MLRKGTYTCIVVGESSLALQCLEILRQNLYFKVMAIISPDVALEQYAKSREIVFYADVKSYLKVQATSRYDFLFSVVNREIIPKKLLKNIRRLAINYHDAPLPKYAGANATSWAILNNESRHGVSWHAVTEKIDEGDLVKQTLFDIEKRETALTLNLKCYHYAVNSFKDLLNDIIQEQIQFTRQDLSVRTYHTIQDKPRHLGIISWVQEAKTIDSLYRALEFGHYPNPLVLPKIVTPRNKLLIPRSIEVLEKRASAAPGVVVDITIEAHVIVATNSYDIKIDSLQDIAGRPINKVDLWEIYGLKRGIQLPNLPEAFYTELANKAQSLCSKESNWIDEYLHLKLPRISFLPRITLRDMKRDALWYESGLANNLYDTELRIATEPSQVIAEVLSAWLIYFSRINNYQNISLHYISSDLLDKVGEIHRNLISHYVPFSVNFSAQSAFNGILIQVTKELENISTKGTYLTDMLLRYPALKEQAARLPIVIQITPLSEKESCPAPEGTFLKVVIDPFSGVSKLLYRMELAEYDYLSFLSRSHQYVMEIFKESLQKPSTPIRQLEMLSKTEQDLLLNAWNATAFDYPKHLTVTQLFEQKALEFPTNPALDCKEFIMTYDELNQVANKIAHYLLEQHFVVPKGRVALCVEQSHYMPIVMLGVLKAGAAYLPIDINHPREHIQHILKDSSASVLIVSKNQSEKLHACLPSFSSIQLLIVEDIDIAAENMPTTNPACKISPQDMAYVIYTSGSTGKPKGILTRHQGLVNLCTEEVRKLGLTQESRVLQYSSISFDASVWEIFGCFAAGATLCIVDTHSLLPGVDLLSTLDHFRVTHLNITPSALRLLPAQAVLPHLSTIVTVGESCPQELVDQWADRYRFINAYGLSETTACATVTDPLSPGDKVSIGKPIANMKTYVLDDYLNLVPIGVPGELYIGGVGLTAGYLDAAENERKFIHNPFATTTEPLEHEHTLLKTRDLVCWLPSGNLEYIARKDDMIKLRGLRVEISAIEHSLQEHPCVQQCVVIPRLNSRGERCLVAYMMLSHKEEGVSTSDLQEFLREKLPTYMVPTYFIVLDHLPLTANGKIDRRMLPLLGEVSSLSDKKHSTPPSTPQENQLYALWKELLPDIDFGIHDSFFALGGDSLLVARLMLRLKEFLDADISFTDFINKPTIVHLAELLNQRGPAVNHAFEFIHDIELPPDIQPIKATQADIEGYQNPTTILLTGATGFLGAHLLRELLMETDARIYCLVRCKKDESHEDRLARIYEQYHQGESLPFERVIPIAGDLGKPLLGLSHSFFIKLCEEVDVVYHNAAYVHHVYDYETLRPNNVLGTRQLIRLITTYKPKQLHYVSSISVASERDEKGRIVEQFLKGAQPNLQELPNGYLQTKWVSERMLSEAHARGIDVSIYRPAWILGRSDNGVSDFANNHLFRLIKGCIQMGVAPDWDIGLNLAPVDFVSKTIVKISLRGVSRGRVFNFANPHLLRWNKFMQWIDQRGFSVKLIPARQWYNEHLVNLDKDNTLFPLLPFYLGFVRGDNVLPAEPVEIPINGNHISQMLQSFYMPFPIIDDRLLKLYFNFFYEQGFLEHPVYTYETRVAVAV